MSIFARPPSPPPRQPSPEPAHTPLPVRTRLRSAASSISPATPPGLRPYKPILTVRSYNDLSSRSNRNTPPTTPRSLPSPCEFHHRRTLSNAIPYRSPPPSPTIVSPPPPVPPIPAFVLSPPTVKHCPQPAAILPIHLPDLDTLPPLGEATNSHRTRKQLSEKSKQPPEKSISTPRAVGMTCLRFFTIRNSKRRTATCAP